MSEGVFKRERVLFHIVGQGSIDIEWEVGAETPEEAFYSAYNPNKFGSLIKLTRDTGDFDFVLTASTEPDPRDVERELGRIEEMEEADMQRAREDEADQFRIHRDG